MDKRLVFQFIKYALLTLLHYNFLGWVLYKDLNADFNEILFALLMIPSGLLNCALLYHGISCIKLKDLNSWLYFIYTTINFFIYLKFTLIMPSLSGAIINT